MATKENFSFSSQTLTSVHSCISDRQHQWSDEKMLCVLFTVLFICCSCTEQKTQFQPIEVTVLLS